MEIVKMHEAKTHLSKVVQKVLKGERVFISKNNEPVMELIPFKKDTKKSAFGKLEGQISLTESFWDSDQEFIDIVESDEN